MSLPFNERDLELARSLPEDRSPALLYLERLGPGSRRTMREAVEKLARLASDGQCNARSLPWHALRIEHTSFLRGQLAQSVAPATANKHLAALRGVLKQAWRLGLMGAEEHQRAIDLPAVHGVAPRPARRLDRDGLRSLVTVCESDRSPAGARDAALFALLFGAGLRRSEVVGLDLSDYDPESGTLSVRVGAGRPAQRFTANPEGRAALDQWLSRRGNERGPLFVPVNKGGRIEIRGLSEQAIYVACRKRAAQAGLPPVSPEDLRRSLPAAAPRRARPAPPSSA